MPTYEINVSRNGRHLFATAERSGQISEAEAMALASEIAESFPDCEVTMTVWTKTGQNVPVVYPTDDEPKGCENCDTPLTGPKATAKLCGQCQGF